MISCGKLGVLVVVVGLALLQHVCAANVWMGMPIQGRSGLFERQVIDCGVGLTACGGDGCIPTGRCCNPDGGGGGWSCRTNALCYTVSGTVDCYATTGTNTVAPTTARDCYDYTATGCDEGIGCFHCLSTASPFCATRSVTGSNDIWIVCNAVGGRDPVPGSATTTRTSPTSTGLALATATDTRPSTTPGSPSTSTITPGPSISTTSTPVPAAGGGTTISTGAIAGIAIAGFVALSVIGVLVFLLYRKGKNTQQAQAQAQPQPLMNDVDRNDMAKNEPMVELSAESMDPRMELQELDAHAIKGRTPTSAPSELV